MIKKIYVLLAVILVLIGCKDNQASQGSLSEDDDYGCNNLYTNRKYEFSAFDFEIVDIPEDSLPYMIDPDLLSKKYIYNENLDKIYSDFMLAFFHEILFEGYQILPPLNDVIVEKEGVDISSAYEFAEKLYDDLRRHIVTYDSTKVIIKTKSSKVEFTNHGGEGYEVRYRYLGYLNEIDSHLIGVTKFLPNGGFYADQYGILLNNYSNVQTKVNDCDIHLNRDRKILAVASFAFGGYYEGGKMIELFTYDDLGHLTSIMSRNVCNMEASIIGWSNDNLYLDAVNDDVDYFRMTFK